MPWCATVLPVAGRQPSNTPADADDVYTHGGCSDAGVSPFAARWMDLEDLPSSDVRGLGQILTFSLTCEYHGKGLEGLRWANPWLRILETEMPGKGRQDERPRGDLERGQGSAGV